jgi:hypothetical protein
MSQGELPARLLPGTILLVWFGDDSMRRSWLYFARALAKRESAAGLDEPALVATARSAMKVSSVSPERCDTTLV